MRAGQPSQLPGRTPASECGGQKGGRSSRLPPGPSAKSRRVLARDGEETWGMATSCLQSGERNAWNEVWSWPEVIELRGAVDDRHSRNTCCRRQMKFVPPQLTSVTARGGSWQLTLPSRTILSGRGSWALAHRWREEVNRFGTFPLSLSH